MFFVIALVAVDVVDIFRAIKASLVTLLVLMSLPFKGPRGTDPSPHQTPETHGPNSISQANGKAKPGPKRVGSRNRDDRFT